MRAVVQRVSRAEVRVDGVVAGQIDRGCCVLLGISALDTADEADLLCRKLLALRIFEDESGRMNRSLDDVAGALLVVSQFTLLADCRRGRRPSFTNAAPPAKAEPLYERFVATAARQVSVATGRFGATMTLALVNDGPVTIVLDTDELH